MKSTSIVSLVLVTVVLSCSSEPEVVAPAVQAGVFVETPCPMPVPDGLIEGESIRCGTVAVPEFHAAPGDKTLTLRVALFPASRRAQCPNRCSSRRPAPEPRAWRASHPKSRVRWALPCWRTGTSC